MSSPSGSATQNAWPKRTWCWASSGAKRGEDTVAALLNAREVVARTGPEQLEAWAYLSLTHVLEGRGSYELAIQAGQEGLARARQLGLARQIAAPIAGNLAESLTSAGRWDEALEIADEVLTSQGFTAAAFTAA